jgi:transcription elongation GreA/GreB family factor
MARALDGREPGEVVSVPGGEAEVLEIRLE